ncbi:MAG: glutathione S-transferase N-terminal domain-containing protein [Rhodanobacter sp.]
MKLYYMPGACPLADHIVLEWIGAPYEAVEVKRDKLNSPDFLKISPAGMVPALVDGDLVLTENVAILHYLADLHPDKQLAGDGTPRGRAEVNHWLAFINSDMHQSFKPIFSPERFLADTSQHAELAANAGKKLRGLFELINAPLTKHDWLAGAKRSIADPYLFVLLRWAKAKAIDLSGLDGLDRFFKRMQDDAGVKAAMHAEGI